jgi:hypothetical protein
MTVPRPYLSLLFLLAILYWSERAGGADAYWFALNLDTEAGELSGSARMHYHNDSGRPLEELRFRLDINLSFPGAMRVLSAKGAGGEALAWRTMPFKFGKLSTDEGQMAVALPKPLGSDEIAVIEIDYLLSCKPALTRELTMLQDDPYPSLDAWYPKAMTYRLGDWTFDDDRLADYEIEIELPAPLRIATTGAVKEEKVEGERARLRLQAHKVRGFTLYGSQWWEVHTRKAGDLTLRCFIAEEHEAWAERFLEAASDAVAFYQAEYGEYPSRHLDIVCPEAAGGHGSFACCHVIGIFIGGPLEERYRWLIAHEVAHQYFGNLVNQRRNEIYWVLIGLGMVMDRHYLIDHGLDGETHAMVMEFYPRVKSQGRDTSLSQTVESLYRAERPWSMQWNLALGHGKGFAVCALLEDLLGEERFKRVIKEILDKHAGGMVSAQDLVACCERVSGEELAWFVEDWIEGDATLDYAVTRVGKGASGWEVVVSRLGTAAFPLVVEARTESGRTLRQRISRDREVQRLTFTTGEELIEVQVGPGGIYPDLDASNNTWTRDQGAD